MARSSITTTNGTKNCRPDLSADLADIFTQTDFYIGLGLAIGSSLFIGSSFIIKKKGLIRLTRYGNLRAGKGGHGYLRDWLWWLGFLTMGLGELANFAAYAFAPATLVTPLGAISVLISAILSSRFLNEHLNLLGKLGCFLCVLGSTVIVLHSPKEGNIANMQELSEKLKDPFFIAYCVLSISISLLLICHFEPKCGHNNVIIYILICSLLGSLSVMGCKGLGIAIRETVSGTQNEFVNWLTWLCLFSLVIFIVIQMNYLNKALDVFNTGVVTPIYYVFFTTFTIFASAVLFKEWVNISFGDVLGNVCGFLTVICAVFLLNGFKDMEISLANLPVNIRRQEFTIDEIEKSSEGDLLGEDLSKNKRMNSETSSLLK